MSQKYNRNDRPKKKITFEDQVKQQHDADILREIEAAREVAKELKMRDSKNRKSVWEDEFDITGGAL